MRRRRVDRPQRLDTVVLASMIGVAPVRAQSAETLIDEGVQLREQGRDAGALERFQRAYAESRSARALAQVALAEQALGRWVDANAHLTEALAMGGEWIETHRGPREARCRPSALGSPGSSFSTVLPGPACA